MRAYIENISKIVEQMDIQLRTNLLIKDGKIQEKKLWENTYIKHQQDRRDRKEEFSISDHIRGMVYAMLSSGIAWERVENSIDILTGKIKTIDEIFHQYNPQILLECSSQELSDKVKHLHCASQSTKKQMNGLIHTNIEKLMQLEKEYDSIDGFYQRFIDKDSSYKTLIKTLSDSDSVNKMVEMGEALNAEYLRNVGYDMAKPDRHIRRILGSNVLACSEHEIVPLFQTFDIVKDIADELGKSVAEVDYILWSYCSKGYGEVCTVINPKCNICVARQICRKHIEK